MKHLLFLTVLFSRILSTFKASSSPKLRISLVSARSVVFVSFIDASFFLHNFLLVSFQIQKAKKPHNKPNFILCGVCVWGKQIKNNNWLLVAGNKRVILLLFFRPQHASSFQTGSNNDDDGAT